MGQASSSLQEQPKPGDLIEFLGPHYKHYGIATDKESVVHLTCLDFEDRCHRSSSLNGKKLVVKFESISAVARNGKYQINNKYDQLYEPRPPKQIVRATLDRIGEEVKYHHRKNNCEHFATLLRYGIALSEQEEQEPEPGDLIEFPRGLYSHYGVAIDNEHVVHLTSADSVDASASVNGPIAVVKKEHLTDVAGNSKYQIEKKYDKKFEPRPLEKIIHDAENELGQKKNYHPFRNNCEHFATQLRYGIPKSTQADNVLVYGPAALGARVGLAGAIVGAIELGRTVQKNHQKSGHSLSMGKR